MIKELKFVCSECGAAFTPKSGVHYRDNYLNTSVADTAFICDRCIDAWHAKWQIKTATFHEKDCVMTADILLADGTDIQKIDCTPIEEEGIVVLGEDVPRFAQEELFKFYTAWDLERKKNILKECSFEAEFMRTTVTCDTFGGERCEQIAFRVSRKGELETEKPLPDYVKEQVLEQYGIYEDRAEIEEFMRKKQDE
ncbi:MAG: hypothetical protein MJ041_02070 [Acidaminococcaceae bacterium]|nr:hypothetical protein [Acidaminococcaceae bacterium]